MGRKSIGMKIRDLKTYEGQKKVLVEWGNGWWEDQKQVLMTLKTAALRKDYDKVMHMIAQLNGITDKRFPALANVFSVISEKDRVLKSASDFIETESNEEQDRIPVSTEKENQSRINDTLKKLDIDNILLSYRSGTSIVDLANHENLSTTEVIKLLVTKGVYNSTLYKTIKDLRKKGIPEQEIEEIMGLDKEALDMYTIYK